MELPILAGPSAIGPDVIVRALLRARAEHAVTFADLADLTAGRAASNPDRPQVHDANCVFDLHRPDAETTVETLLDEIEAHYREVGTTWYAAHPSEPPLDEELAARLEARGFVPVDDEVFQLVRAPADLEIDESLQVVPARAVRQRYRRFARDLAAHEYGDAVADEIAACVTDALDEPRFDVLVGRSEGETVAAAGIFASGEIGIIDEVATHPEHRRRGHMKALFSHVLDFCARSQFKAIVLVVDGDNAPARRLYESLGFERIASTRHHVRAETLEQLRDDHARARGHSE